MYIGCLSWIEPACTERVQMSLSWSRLWCLLQFLWKQQGAQEALQARRLSSLDTKEKDKVAFAIWTQPQHSLFCENFAFKSPSQTVQPSQRFQFHTGQGIGSQQVALPIGFGHLGHTQSTQNQRQKRTKTELQIQLLMRSITKSQNTHYTSECIFAISRCFFYIYLFVTLYMTSYFSCTLILLSTWGWNSVGDDGAAGSSKEW